MAFNLDEYGPPLVKQYLAMANACLMQGTELGGTGFNVKAQVNAALYQLSQALKWHAILLMPKSQRDQLMDAECTLVLRRFTSLTNKEESSDTARELAQQLDDDASWLSELIALIETLALTPAVFVAQQADMQYQNVIASNQQKKCHWSQKPIGYYFTAHTALSELINRHNDAAVEN